MIRDIYIVPQTPEPCVLFSSAYHFLINWQSLYSQNIMVSFEHYNFWPKTWVWNSITKRTLVNMSHTVLFQIWFNVLSSSPNQLIQYLTQCSTFSELVNASRQNPWWSVLDFWKIKFDKLIFYSISNWIITACSLQKSILKLFFFFKLKIQFTPPRSPRISRLKSQIMKPTFLS